jgi:hypothetical protein
MPIIAQFFATDAHLIASSLPARLHLLDATSAQLGVPLATIFAEVRQQFAHAFDVDRVAHIPTIAARVDQASAV